MRPKLRSPHPRPASRRLSPGRLFQGLAMVVLGSALLLGVSAVPAGALITVTGHITLYSTSSLGFHDLAPYAIAGTPSGDLWVITNDDPLRPEQVGQVGRVSTSGVLDGVATLPRGGNWVTVNNLAIDSSGNAYLTDGGVPSEVTYSSVSLSEDTSAELLLRPVTVQGTTPYWGTEPAGIASGNELYSGFPTISGAHATVAPVTALGAAPGEIDMIQGTRDFGFYFGGTLDSCIGGAQFLPADSDIVNLSEGSAGLWLADSGEKAIWQYMGSCTAKEKFVPDGTAPVDITDGSDGNVYFTTSSGVWEYLPSSGVFYKYTDPGLNNPEGITLGSDGNIWFTNVGGQQIGKLVPYVPSNPYVTLHQWTLPSGTGATPCAPCHWMAVNVQTVPPGYGNETDVGYAYQNPGPGLEALYACTDAGGQGDYLSLDPTGNCADSDVPASGPPPTALGIQGYVYSSVPIDGTDALELYQCNDTTTNDWLSATTPPGSTPAGTEPPCGATGYNFDDALGYVVNAGPTVPTIKEPTTKEQCKDGGWRLYTDNRGIPFKNEGDCVSFVATGGRNS